MALVNQALKLEITPWGVPPVLHVTEYDENMQVVAQLFQRGKYYEIPSGTTAKVEGTLAGHPFSADATVDGSNVTFELTKSMTAYAGRAWTKIKLTKDGKPVSTCGFWLECDRAGVEAGDVIGAPGFEEQIKDAVDEWLDEHGGGALPPGGKAGQVLVSDGQGGGNWATWSDTSGLTTEQINALDGMFKVCAFTKDNVSAEYTAFKTAFGIDAATITGISVTYSGGDVAVGTALSDLTGIVVTATYSDGSTETVTGYTLSGEIVEGDNTISVTYNGKTATFTVTGTVENERVEHIVSGQTFPVTLTWYPLAFDVTPALAHFVNGESTSTYYDVELDVESISSENAYVMVSIGSGSFTRNASDYAGQTGTLKMTGEVWHSTMSDASQIQISCNKGTETSNQTAVITGVRIYER